MMKFSKNYHFSFKVPKVLKVLKVLKDDQIFQQKMHITLKDENWIRICWMNQHLKEMNDV